MEKPETPTPLADIEDLNGYMRQYGRLLQRNATDGMDPLHVPGRDPVVQVPLGLELFAG